MTTPRKIELSYALTDERDRDSAIHNPLIALLQAVRSHGSIGAAAQALDLSYRHVWGELRRWEGVMGEPLIVWERGQSARLTEVATKLLWAEREAQARLAPQIEALRAELERTFAIAFDPSAHVLTVHASHDDALLRLRDHASAGTGSVHLDLRFMGSVDAIRALNEGRCSLAGFHARATPAAGSLTALAYRPLLKPGVHKLIGFARRFQGLMVAPGNPLGLRTLADALQPPVRLALREPGAGTRVLFEELVQEQGGTLPPLLARASLHTSHLAVAQAVGAGGADAGLGIESAARAQGLDFLPLIEEHYHLVCLHSLLDQPPLQALLQVLASDLWQQALSAMPGHAPHASGEVQSLREVLPWWNFRQPKRRPAQH